MVYPISATVSPWHSDTAGLVFNPAKPQVMHIDLNSCFASVEQQANPLLRDKPIAVVHSDAPYGCILAPSIEAKLWGVKTGMTLSEGKLLCPWLIAREADPPKYRQVHAQFAKLLADYSPHVIPKSIDEFVLTLPMVPVPKGSDLEGRAQPCPNNQQGRSDPKGICERTDLTGIVSNIKSRIKSEIGDYLRVSIGVSTNQNLAKLASGLHKPDGFDILDKNNFLNIYQTLKLQDFCGINIHNEARLHSVGIFTVPQFYQASIQTLTSAFQSVLGRYWYTRLHGYEVDDVEFNCQSFGQSYVLPHPMDLDEWRPILAKLIAKAARRLRAAGYSASGIHLALRFSDGTYWHAGHNTDNLLSDDASLLTSVLNLLQRTDPCLRRQVCKPVKKIAFTCFGLGEDSGQLSCLTDKIKQKSLVNSLDKINDKWGEYSVTYGSFLGSAGHVRDAIAFGK
jgi:DNA polymerase-4